MKIIILLLCFYLSLCNGICQAATWVKLNENSQSKLLLDKQSIANQDEYKKAWIKVEYKSPQQNAESVEVKTYNQSKALWYFDCKAQKSATTQVFQYANQTLIYSAGVEIKGAEFTEPVPESDVEIAMRHVCKAPSTNAQAETKNTKGSAPKSKEDKKQTPQQEGLAQSNADESKAELPAKKIEDSVQEKASAPKNEAPAKSSPKLANNKPTSQKPHWGYQGKEGPDHWATLNDDFAVCATGQNQSPINIDATIHAALKPIRSIQKFAAKEIVNNGHTIQINFKEGNMMVLDKSAFQMKQMSFHTPSEHTINGQSFALEAQFLHQDSKGNLAIVGVMFKEGDDNPALEKLWSQMPQEQGNPIVLKNRFTPNELMPTRPQYYRFSGSLTTPPCSEGVRWIIMKSPLTASKAQIKAFEDITHPNNRPVQALNGRVVLE